MTYTLVVQPAVEDRWLIPAPGPNETLRSVLHRAADLYKKAPQRLWDTLREASDGDNAGDIDDPSPADMGRMARTLGVGQPRLERLRLPETDMYLAPKARQTYCMACWREDDRAGRPRHFRRAWAGVLTLQCDRHNTPLFPWHPPRGRHAPSANDDITMAELTWRATQALPEASEGLRAIHAFAAALTECLSHGALWPTQWRGDAVLARSLLIEVMAIDSLGNAPLVASEQAPLVMRALVHSGRPMPEAGITAGWDRLRHTCDPGVRRMALWLVGAWLNPAWPQTFQPSLKQPSCQ